MGKATVRLHSCILMLFIIPSGFNCNSDHTLRKCKKKKVMWTDCSTSISPVMSTYLSCVSPSISTDMFSADVCGPDKELDVETCQCVCQRKDPTRDCGPNRHLDHNTCQCVCNMPPAPSCPLNHVFNKETCQCVCSKTCPRHQPLNKTKCSCECNESPNKCFLKGRRFHQATCR